MVENQKDFNLEEVLAWLKTNNYKVTRPLPLVLLTPMSHRQVSY